MRVSVATTKFLNEYYYFPSYQEWFKADGAAYPELKTKEEQYSKYLLVYKTQENAAFPDFPLSRQSEKASFTMPSYTLMRNQAILLAPRVAPKARVDPLRGGEPVNWYYYFNSYRTSCNEIYRVRAESLASLKRKAE